MSILNRLGAKDITQDNKEKFYAVAIYGRSGTGKTTVATRSKDAIVLDINENGTSVAEAGIVFNVENYLHFTEIVKNLPAILKEVRSAGKEANVVVIETVQKLRDITMDNIMAGKTKSPTFNDWGEGAKRIVAALRFIMQLQQMYKFHLIVTGHEGINKDKNDEGATINPKISIDAQSQIHDALVSQVDAIGHTFIETDSENKFNHVLSFEPSPIFLTKIRKPPSVAINNYKIYDADINKIVNLIRKGVTE